jgi:hypothetical protein
MVHFRAESLSAAKRPFSRRTISITIQFAGRPMPENQQIFYRWCFSDLATARDFIEQFGGEFC